MFKERKKKIINKIEKFSYDEVICSSPENIFYITGYWGSGIALINEDDTVLFTSSLEFDRAKVFANDCTVKKVEFDKLGFLLKYVKKNSKICIDDFQINLKNNMERLFKKKLVCNPNIFYSIRKIKDNDEISIIKKGADLADKLYDDIIKYFKPNISERELAAYIISNIICFGGDLPTFSSTLNPIIIASGPNGKYPHAQLTNRKIRIGDAVIIDITFRFLGYVIDVTRTFIIKHINPVFEKIYAVVKFSQEEGIKKAKPSVKSGIVDKKVRELITNQGYDKFFIHKTGHGVGLEVHEPPTLKPNGQEVLEKNEVVTIEPGIYTKQFGVRIEDMILIDDQPKTITSFTKDLTILD